MGLWGLLGHLGGFEICQIGKIWQIGMAEYIDGLEIPLIKLNGLIKSIPAENPYD